MNRTTFQLQTQREKTEAMSRKLKETSAVTKSLPSRFVCDTLHVYLCTYVPIKPQKQL